MSNRHNKYNGDGSLRDMNEHNNHSRLALPNQQPHFPQLARVMHEPFPLAQSSAIQQMRPDGNFDLRIVGGYTKQEDAALRIAASLAAKVFDPGKILTGTELAAVAVEANRIATATLAESELIDLERQKQKQLSASQQAAGQEPQPD
jgi:hypothetical protein